MRRARAAAYLHVRSALYIDWLLISSAAMWIWDHIPTDQSPPLSTSSVRSRP